MSRQKAGSFHFRSDRGNSEAGSLYSTVERSAYAGNLGGNAEIPSVPYILRGRVLFLCAGARKEISSRSCKRTVQSYTIEICHRSSA